MKKQKTIQHGTLVSLNGLGVLLLGPSASGKSDLALRMTTHPSPFLKDEMQAILVADDQVEIFTNNTENNDIKLYGQAPASLAGLLEVRHLGIKTVSYREKSEIHCAIKLKKYDEIERLPEEALSLELIKGQSLPLFYLDPFEPSALNKLNLILNEMAS